MTIIIVPANHSMSDANGNVWSISRQGAVTVTAKVGSGTHIASDNGVMYIGYSNGNWQQLSVNTGKGPLLASLPTTVYDVMDSFNLDSPVSVLG